jgi:hypothetical protein
MVNAVPRNESTLAAFATSACVEQYSILNIFFISDKPWF